MGWFQLTFSYNCPFSTLRPLTLFSDIYTLPSKKSTNNETIVDLYILYMQRSRSKKHTQICLNWRITTDQQQPSLKARKCTWKRPNMFCWCIWLASEVANYVNQSTNDNWRRPILEGSYNTQPSLNAGGPGSFWPRKCCGAQTGQNGYLLSCTPTTNGKNWLSV